MEFLSVSVNTAQLLVSCCTVHCPKGNRSSAIRTRNVVGNIRDTTVLSICGIFHEVSRFPLHFMLYRRNSDYFLDSVEMYVYFTDYESE